MSENKTLEELVKEHGFGVKFKSVNNPDIIVIGESAVNNLFYVAENVAIGQPWHFSKTVKGYYYEKSKVKRAQYLLIPKSDAHVPAKCDEYFKDEKDFLSIYDKDRVEKAIRLTETEREFDW